MTLLKEYDFVIGIDPGKRTGLAKWDIHRQAFESIDTMLVHQAFKEMQRILTDDTFIRLEDARQVRFKTKAERAQGAGSIKRDVEIWIDFLQDYHVPYELVRPQKKMTKWPSAVFAHMTGWKKPTSTAGMLPCWYTDGEICPRSASSKKDKRKQKQLKYERSFAQHNGYRRF